MLSSLISIIPIAFYLLGIKAMDALSFTTWRRLSTCIIAGVTACAIAFLCTNVVHWEQGWITPLLEELLKALPFLFLISGVAFFAESLVYGMAVGAGFALVENILYVTFNTDITIMQCVVRGFGTALIHMGCTALFATIVLTLSRIKGFPRILAFVIALAASYLLHFTYNQFFLPAFIQLLVTVVIFCTLFLALYGIEERLITRWLDLSISDDVRLLGAIKEGKLDATRSGQYLKRIKEDFHPEVFFDMVVYLQLYLELSIKAKSRLIMREAEMDVPVSPEEHAENLERIKELSTLRSNIGVAGRTVLAPLLRVKHVDRWVITELL